MPLAYLKDAVSYWTSWLRHRPAAPPKHAQFIFTYFCQARCVHCNIWEKYELKPELAREELSTAEWLRVVDELAEMGVKTLSFSGGEPFLRKDLFEVVARAKERGLSVNVTSNGMLLSAPRVREGLFSTGLDSLTVSLDGTKEIHDKTRGAAIFDAALESFAWIDAEKRRRGTDRPALNAASVLMSENLFAIAELNRTLAEKPFPVHHHFHSVVTSGERFMAGIREIEMAPPSDSDLAAFVRRMGKKVNRHYFAFMRRYNRGEIRYPSPARPCLAGIFNVVVTETGNVLPCCTWYDGGVAGNVREGPLSELWSSPRFNALRRKIYEGKCVGCWISTYAKTSTDFWPGMILRNAAYLLRKRLAPKRGSPKKPRPTAL